MSQPRYLTKSRYVSGLECPTKLFYTGKKQEYADQKFDDRFLQQLANGGFQVGELAKCYYPNGIPVDTLEYDEAVAKTEELLKRHNVTIFEAAFRFNNLFVRADIIEKNGNDVKLIEVKAKSWPPKTKSAGLIGVRGGIDGDFRSKIADLAFQSYVVGSAHPEWNISLYFLLADKTSKCPTDGLHQKFRIKKEGTRRRCTVEGELAPEDLDPQILCLVPADDACKKFKSEADPYDGVRTFEQHIDFLAGHYERDEKVKPRFGVACHKCEFQTNGTDDGLKNGRHECWQDAMGWTPEESNRANVLSIWAFLKKDKLIAEGKINLADLTEQDIGIKLDDRPGLSRPARQWKQVSMVRDGETAHWIDKEGLRAEMAKWKFPLHFIDFETSMTAIPFQKGRRPYEAIAFQFSHHTVDEHGNVKHQGEWLESRPGVFPNYDFIRALRQELCGDHGTIFRYAPHENTYLNHIWEQLKADESVLDREELCAFIEQISHSKEGQQTDWCGPRDMLDMYTLVQRHYFHPLSPGGSCSIKHILPAVLNSSEYLQEKYSKPIYGADGGIPSKNFKDWTWIVRASGDALVTGEIPNPNSQIRNPYALLEPMFADATPKDLDLLLSEEEDRGGIREGGAAMAAYLLLQFEEMSDYERQAIERSLRQYCEIDTLAMVMIYEAWKAEL